MAEFINTVDVLGDDAVIDSIIDRSIKEFKDNTITMVGGYVFAQCDAMTSVDLPAVTNTAEGAFSNCDILASVNLPAVTNVGYMAFINCLALTKMDLPVATNIRTDAFTRCRKLATIILRKNSICSLANVNALGNTPIANGTGYIYIPAALKEQYAQSTNWSTYAAQFRALEDYTVDGTIWGDLDENKI